MFLFDAQLDWKQDDLAINHTKKHEDKCHMKLLIIRKSLALKRGHTIRKCQKMARQNTLKILLLNDANMIGEH